MGSFRGDGGTDHLGFSVKKIIISGNSFLSLPCIYFFRRTNIFFCVTQTWFGFEYKEIKKYGYTKYIERDQILIKLRDIKSYSLNHSCDHYFILIWKNEI